jgi:hypothetical protein
MKVNNGFSDQELLNIASMYDTPNHIKKENTPLYRLLWKRKLLNSVKYKVGKRKRYTNEEVLNEGAKYDTPSDFKKYGTNMYAIAHRRNIIKDIKFKKGYQVNHYTLEEILEEASKYDHPAHLQRENPKIYSAAQKKGVLKLINYKVGYIGSRRKRMVYTYEFSDNSVYVGLTYHEKQRKAVHLADDRSPVAKHIQKTGLTPVYTNITNGYIDAMEAAILEEKLIVKYKSEGKAVLNKVKGGCLGGGEIKWYNDKIIEVARQCKNRVEFRRRFPNEHRVAIKRGIFKEATKHMEDRINYHTIESVTKTAKQYDTIKEFIDNHPSMWSYIYTRKNAKELKKEIFKHTHNAQWSVLILDTETGIYYYGIKEARLAKSIKVNDSTLSLYLNNPRKNKTSLVRV